MTPEFLELIIISQIIQLVLAVIVFIWIAYKWWLLEKDIKQLLKK